MDYTDSDSLPRPDIPTQFDVLVVGAGAAGLYAALCLPETLQVGLITKDILPLSASDWAQGGMAAAIDPNDSSTLHVEDTMQAGAGLCDLEAVKFLVEQAPRCVQSLVDMGVDFDRRGSHLALTLEAAHSRPRVLHAADTTGRAMVSILTEQVLKRKNIRVIQQAFALSLWLTPLGSKGTGEQGSKAEEKAKFFSANSEEVRCQGISLAYQGRVTWVRAGAIVLATGGGGQVFAQTTNPSVSTGDGVAIAWRAGAMLRDLEFVQFHPTALTKKDAPRFLISEAVRGEGAHLVDSQGHRFAFDYHPAGELAPRDIVSRAIFSHLQRTASDPATGHVWLDFRPIPAEKISRRFPNIIQVCQRWGIDVFSQPVPVAPAAHYWMGGIPTDLMNRTSIPGLYAVGETASTGVHGANRLASNSLLECIVFGAQMAHLETIKEQSMKEERLQSSTFTLQASDWETQKAEIEALRRELPRLMWQSAGICRSEEVLEDAIAQVEIWRQQFTSLPLSQYLLSLPPNQNAALNLPNASLQIRTWGETQNLLDVAYLILKSAAFRQESRGGHYRLDYPQTSPEWQAHTLVQKDFWWKSSSLLTDDLTLPN